MAWAGRLNAAQRSDLLVQTGSNLGIQGGKGPEGSMRKVEGGGGWVLGSNAEHRVGQRAIG